MNFQLLTAKKGPIMYISTLDLLETMTPTEANAALTEMGKSLTAMSTLDVGTGNVRVDETALANAFARSLPINVAANVLRGVRETVSDGVAISQGEVVAPWRALTSQDVAPSLQPELVRSALQLSTVPSAILPLEILSRYPLVTPAVAERLGNTFLSSSDGPVVQLKNEDIHDDEPSGGGGGFGTVVSLTVEQMINCFATAVWEIHWWGVSIGFGPACGRAIGAALSGASAPTLIAALQAGISAGGAIAAAIGAAAAAVGGYIILGIAINAFITGNLILGATNANGVWVETSWLGPIVWASGR